MTKYYILEQETSGFGFEYTVEAKTLSSAKRLASRLQEQINTTLSICEIVGNEYSPVSKKGALEYEGSKWEDCQF